MEVIWRSLLPAEAQDEDKEITKQRAWDRPPTRDLIADADSISDSDLLPTRSCIGPYKRKLLTGRHQ